jgi:acetylornithine deacetylase/succinyl-diaminopimelate desuccinylase-like protein
MNGVIKKKIAGCSKEISDTLFDFMNTGCSKQGDFQKMVAAHMKKFGYDDVSCDNAGNVTGVMRGYGSGPAMGLFAQYDVASAGDGNGGANYLEGFVSALYTGAAIKRALVPLRGDLVVGIVAGSRYNAFGTEYLFKHALKKYSGKFDGVVLCEPTNEKVYLGHKGGMEYQITVTGKMESSFLNNKGVNMLGTMFPLIHELEAHSRTLPRDSILGNASLAIKDIRYQEASLADSPREFSVIVDRSFVPDEAVPDILERARLIAERVYRLQGDVKVSASVTSNDSVAELTDVDTQRRIMPWKIDSSHPYVSRIVSALKDAGVAVETGYWEKRITEGAYTFGERNIPTIGYGCGSEVDSTSRDCVASSKACERTVYGLSCMVNRVIGMPCFGWDPDSI